MTDAVSPRILLRVILYAPDHETVDHVAYEATQARGCVRNQDGVGRDVLGYAEFPRQTSIGRTTDGEAFTELVEAKAEYLHWKEDVQKPE